MGVKRRPLLPLWLWVVLAAILVGCLLLTLLVSWAAPDASGFAAYGALLQGVAGSLALVLVWRTLQLQREELKLQRRELVMTRGEMKQSTTEQRRLADQATAQLEHLKRQGELIKEQMDRQIRPVLHAVLSRTPVLDLNVRNDGHDVAIVTRLFWWEDGHEVDLPSVLETYRQRWRGEFQWSIGHCNTGRVEVREGIQMLRMEMHLIADDARTVLNCLASISLCIEYEDMFGQLQPALTVPLGQFNALRDGQHCLWRGDPQAT